MKTVAQDLETEELSLDEAKDIARKIREARKMISNRLIFAEVRDRDIFAKEKQTRREVVRWQKSV